MCCVDAQRYQRDGHMSIFRHSLIRQSMAWGSRIARMEFAHGQGWRLGVVSRQVHGGGDRGTGIRMSDGNLRKRIQKWTYDRYMGFHSGLIRGLSYHHTNTNAVTV